MNLRKIVAIAPMASYGIEGEQQRDIMKLACDLFVKNEKRTQHFLQNANSNEPQKLSLSKTLELDM